MENGKKEFRYTIVSVVESLSNILYATAQKNLQLTLQELTGKPADSQKVFEFVTRALFSLRKEGRVSEEVDTLSGTVLMMEQINRLLCVRHEFSWEGVLTAYATHTEPAKKRRDEESSEEHRNAWRNVLRKALLAYLDNIPMSEVDKPGRPEEVC